MDILGILMAFGIVICIFLIVFTFLYQRGGKGSQHDTGVNITASVVELKEQYDIDIGKSYYVSYEYAVSGQTYQKRDRINKSTYESLNVGDQIEAVHLPDDPQEVKLARWL